jgi:hypothetical protein
MTVEFELNGQPFTALNAGPQFKFNEAVSFHIMSRTQEEVDLYWNQLTQGGDPRAQQCGWLRDKSEQSRSGEGRPRHGSVAADEEARHRGAETGIRG